MADNVPFRPTLEDLQDLATGMPSRQMMTQSVVPPMGVDPIAKPGLSQGANPMAGAMPIWMLPFAAMAGMRGRPPRMQAPANQNVRFPMLDSPNAVPRGGDPSRSQVGQLNQLNPQQFQIYLDARSRGMSPQQAMSVARGE